MTSEATSHPSAAAAAHDPYRIHSVEELRTLYDMPNEVILKTQFSFLDDYAIRFIAQSSLVCIASQMDGRIDASPRGGAPGFVQVLDRKTLAIPDWPGNNKIETLTSIIHSGRCGLLFLVPRQDMFLRVHGTAVVTRDPALLQAMQVESKPPKLAIKLQVLQAYFHCGKALRRSKIWQPESWPPAHVLPTAGKMILDQAKLADSSAEELESMYQKSLRETLY